MPDENPEIPPLKEGDFEKGNIAGKPTVRSKDFQVIYSNFIQAGFTAWDIRLNLGLLGLSETGEPQLTELAAVVLTPQMAKALLAVLSGHIKAYEQDNGEIQMPRSIIDEAKARKAQAKEAESESAKPVPAKE